MSNMEKLALERLRQAAALTFGQAPVRFAYLYGSMATGRDRPDSDVDVAIYLAPEVGPERYLDLSLELGSRLEDAARAGNVDLVILNEAPLALLGRILRQRIVIYSVDEPARVHFESRTFREFCDFDFHASALDRELLRAISEGWRG